ncbi:trypsin-like [Culicoides brevitarsis]|uniref:trypsin-like n=1 Tax=Culicoides brevitarsis TaxID=469753 RepID=UPI00307B888F
MKLFISIILLGISSLVLSSPEPSELSHSYGQERIVGGVNAKPNEFPYQVSLQRNENSHFCGGSILSELWVVTAAHCKLDEPMEVVAGEHDFKEETGREQRRNVVEFITHENYGGSVGPDDIAVVRIDEPLKMNDYVQPINLPQPNTYPQGRAILSGWGSISRIPGVYPNILQKANMPIHSQSTCKRLWTNSPYADTNVCAGPLLGSSSSCSGDSGGPLAQKTDNEFTLVGIVSWGQIPCGTPLKPGVFVEVSQYIDWISQHTE